MSTLCRVVVAVPALVPEQRTGGNVPCMKPIWPVGIGRGLDIRTRRHASGCLPCPKWDHPHHRRPRAGRHQTGQAAGRRHQTRSRPGADAVPQDRDGRHGVGHPVRRPAARQQRRARPQAVRRRQAAAQRHRPLPGPQVSSNADGEQFLLLRHGTPVTVPLVNVINDLAAQRTLVVRLRKQVDNWDAAHASPVPQQVHRLRRADEHTRWNPSTVE